MSRDPPIDPSPLRLRADLLRRAREFFYRHGLLEVETPILSADVVVDRHLDPFVTTLAPDPRRPDEGRRLYLQTSPEFGMKRLLAAGAGRIYQITRAFRNGEVGPWHNPEFTILEWYRPGDDMHAGMQFLSDLSEELLGLGPAESITYADAFQRRVGLDPHKAPAAELIAAADRLGIDVPRSMREVAPTSIDRDALLELLLGGTVEPHLGVTRPAILFDYPASQAALAKVRQGDPRVAERFELYVRGVELANGYHELTDPGVLRARAAAANTQRAADGKPRLPEQSRLLDAMEAGLTDATGVAMGFDRVVMVAAGAKSLAEVMPFFGI